MAISFRVGNQTVVLSNKTAGSLIDFLIESAHVGPGSEESVWVSTLIEERKLLYPGADIVFTDMFPEVDQLTFWLETLKEMVALVVEGKIGNREDLSWRQPLLKKVEPIERLLASEISRP